jgi:hypothetical protein
MSEITQKDIQEMENVIAEELIVNDDENISQVREIVTCKNIQMGEQKYREFRGVIRLNGRFVEKIGRPLGFDELSELMPNMFESIENIEGSPKDVIDVDGEFTNGLTVATNEENAIRRIKATAQMIAKEQGVDAQDLVDSLIAQRELLKEEIKLVEEKGVDWNNNIVWDIWMILRAIRQRNYMEGENLPVDYLIELYSHIPHKEYKKIKQHYQNSFNNR